MSAGGGDAREAVMLEAVMQGRDGGGDATAREMEAVEAGRRWRR